MTWSWTNAVQIQKKKKIKEKNELKREKWDVEKKSGVMKIEHYSKTCWLREEEARHLQLQIHKLRAFNNASVSSKTWKNSHFGSWPNSPVSHRVVWISYSRLIFVRWLNSRGVSYPGGTALWSWWSSLFQKAEVVRRCCTWNWTCLAALDVFDVICVQKWTKLSQGCSCSAPFPWFWACHQHDEELVHVGTSWLCCLSLQSSSLPPTLDALSMHVRCANYQAAIWRRALHPGSSLPGRHGYGWLCKPECGMLVRVIHPLKSNGWLVLLPRPQALLDLVKCGCTSGCFTQRCRCRKDILIEMKFVSAQTARISHTSKHHSLHTMTKRLMVTHDLIKLHCVVLLQLECWKESAHHFCLLDHYMFYNIQPYIYPSVHQSVYN